MLQHFEGVIFVGSYFRKFTVVKYYYMYFGPWKIALACCFFIHIHNDFSLFLQLLYLLFTCLCLPTEVQGKPYKLEAEEEKRFTEDLLT